MTMTLVETIEVGAGGAASIEFTSIPQDADDLLLVVSLRTGDAVLVQDGFLQFNSDTANNYSYRKLDGNGSGAFSSSGTGNGYLGTNIPGTSATSNSFNSMSIYVPNYASSSVKSYSADIVMETNGSTAYQNLHAGSWSGTSAISSIKVSTYNLLVQYSTASLYKITKA